MKINIFYVINIAFICKWMRKATDKVLCKLFVFDWENGTHVSKMRRDEETNIKFIKVGICSFLQKKN